MLLSKRDIEHEVRPRSVRSAWIVTTWGLIFFALLLSGSVTRAADPEGGPLAEPFNEADLHTTWRNMANEQVMFALDMKDMPVKIGKQRQLFLDNYLIAEAKNVLRQVHQPVRHPGNPVLKMPADRVPETIRVVQLKQFKTPPRFRMWYWSYSDWHTLPSGQKIRFATSYATSNDGIHWKMPNLDLYKVQGVTDRNVVLPYGLMRGMFVEPDEPDPQKRFKALVCVEGTNPVIPEGFYLHTSPDGIHWKADMSHYVIPSLHSGYHLPQNGIGDSTRFWWDPLRKKYIGDVKFVLPGTLRCRGMMESDDLIHWTRPHPTFFARAADTQIYGHVGFVYQGMYVGMRWIYLPKYDLKYLTRAHSMNVELDCSRDGRIWTRVGAGQPFMDFDPHRKTWDAAQMKPTVLLEVGDEIWIYYTSAPANPAEKNPKSQWLPYSAGLATLKRDRFASINAGDDTGTLVTRPLHFNGKKLHLNADIAKGGKLTVAVVTLEGRPIARYDNNRCKPLQGNRIDMPVAWQDNSKLPQQTTSAVRFRFELQNTKLYSFWIE